MTINVDESEYQRTLEAIDEIEAVLRKHDLVGYCTIVSASRAHWLYHVDALWSCMSLNQDTNEVRVKLDPREFKSDAEAERVANATAHAIMQGRDLAAQQFVNFTNLADKIKQHWDIEHESGCDPRER